MIYIKNCSKHINNIDKTIGIQNLLREVYYTYTIVLLILSKLMHFFFFFANDS